MCYFTECFKLIVLFTFYERLLHYNKQHVTKSEKRNVVFYRYVIENMLKYILNVACY